MIEMLSMTAHTSMRVKHKPGQSECLPVCYIDDITNFYLSFLNFTSQKEARHSNNLQSEL